MPLDVFALLLRFMLYAGTILAAGSVALRFSLAVNHGGGFDRMLRLQTGFGLGGEFFWHKRFNLVDAEGNPDQPDAVVSHWL